MKQETTLVSLAILSSRINKGSDYLDFFAPFIEYLLRDYNKPVNSIDISILLEKEFGLCIPHETIELILIRLIKRKVLIRKDRVVMVQSISEKTMSFMERKAEFSRKVLSLIQQLVSYSKQELKVDLTDQQATELLTSFLSDFSYSFIGFVLGKCPLPNFEKIDTKEKTIISRFIKYIAEYELYTFENLIIIAQGNMLANALLLPENLCSIGNFKNVSFYFDTPLLLSILDLSGDVMHESTKQLISLIKKLKGRVYCFSHSIEETRRVIIASADNYQNGYGQLLVHAKGQNLSKSDLIIKSQKLLELLEDEGIEIEQTPPYKAQYQIDEKIIEEKLRFYRSKKAREDDVNSIRSIYVLRGDSSVTNIKTCKAILVTSNESLVECANSYRLEHKDSTFPTLITNFTLKNMAWLLNTPDISTPKIELMAYSFAATIPGKGFLSEISQCAEQMKEKGEISIEDYQLLKAYEIQEAYSDYTKLSDEVVSADSINSFLAQFKNGIIAEERRKSNILEETNKELKHREECNLKIEKEMKDKSKTIGDKFTKYLLVVAKIILILGSLIWFIYSISETKSWLIIWSLLFFISGLISLINSVHQLLIKKIQPCVIRIVYVYLSIKESIKAGMKTQFF